MKKIAALLSLLSLSACQSPAYFPAPVGLRAPMGLRAPQFQQARFARFNTDDADFQATTYQELILSHPSVEKLKAALDQHFRNTQVVGLRYVARFGHHYYVESILQTQSGSRFENAGVAEFQANQIQGYDESVSRDQLEIRPLVFQPVSSLPEGIEQQLKEKLEREWRSGLVGIQHIGQLKDQPVYRLKAVLKSQAMPMPIESDLEIRVRDTELESIFER